MIGRDKQNGFSLMELLVVMAIFGFVIAGASQMFVGILKDFKQQGRLAITNIEGVLGLEIMRRDIQGAGYGLFTDRGSVVMNHVEVSDGMSVEGFALNDNPMDPPRALVIGAASGLNGSDRLAIKATNVGLSERGDLWTYNQLGADKVSSTNYNWQAAGDKLLDSDRVIMLSLEMKEKAADSKKTLVPTNGGSFFTQYAKSDDADPDPAGFSPDRKEISGVYFIADTADPKMPFNRADYYVAAPTTSPAHCATGTGTLYKRVVENVTAKTGYLNALPLLECVAGMQVALVLVNEAGTSYSVTETTLGLTADVIRRVKEVRVYILAQEGQLDRSFTNTNNPVWIGEQAPFPVGTVGQSIDLSAFITEWQHYRWKLYTLAARPANIK